MGELVTGRDEQLFLFAIRAKRPSWNSVPEIVETSNPALFASLSTSDQQSLVDWIDCTWSPYEEQFKKQQGFCWRRALPAASTQWGNRGSRTMFACSADAFVVVFHSLVIRVTPDIPETIILQERMIEESLHQLVFDIQSGPSTTTSLEQNVKSLSAWLELIITQILEDYEQYRFTTGYPRDDIPMRHRRFVLCQRNMSPQRRSPPPPPPLPPLEYWMQKGHRISLVRPSPKYESDEFESCSSDSDDEIDKNVVYDKEDRGTMHDDHVEIEPPRPKARIHPSKLGKAVSRKKTVAPPRRDSRSGSTKRDQKEMTIERPTSLVSVSLSPTVGGTLPHAFLTSSSAQPSAGRASDLGLLLDDVVPGGGGPPSRGPPPLESTIPLQLSLQSSGPPMPLTSTSSSFAPPPSSQSCPSPQPPPPPPPACAAPQLNRSMPMHPPPPPPPPLQVVPAQLQQQQQDQAPRPVECVEIEYDPRMEDAWQPCDEDLCVDEYGDEPEEWTSDGIQMPEETEETEEPKQQVRLDEKKIEEPRIDELQDGKKKKPSKPQEGPSCCTIWMASARNTVRKYASFHWHPTFMRMTLLAPKTVLYSLAFLPLAAALGVLVVPTLAILIGCFPSGRSGMFQHESKHDVTSSVWGSLCLVGIALAWICNINDLLASVLAPLAIIYIFGSLSLRQESSMFLNAPSEYRQPRVRYEFISNYIAYFSLALEYVQLLSLAVLTVSVDSNFVDASLSAAVNVIVKPLGASVLVQFIIAVILAGILLGFLTVAVMLTSQPEERVSRVSEQKEKEGNLSWLKLIVGTISDTAFMSVISSLSAAIQLFHSEIPADSEWSNSEAFYWLRCVVQVVLFAFVCASLLVVLPIQAVFPDIWLPKGVDVRPAPLFALSEKFLKLILITSISLGPSSSSVPYFRTGVAAFVFAGLVGLIAFFKNPMSTPFARNARMTSFVSAGGTLALMYAPAPLPAVLFWLVACSLGFGVAEAGRRFAWNRTQRVHQKKKVQQVSALYQKFRSAENRFDLLRNDEAV
eukprot:ANDGO_08021.mRNA.1 hypothetical protein